MSDPAAPSDRGPNSGPLGSGLTRGAKRILVVTAVSVVALIGIAVWVLVVPVQVDHDEWRNGGRAFQCHQLDTAEISAIRADLEELCEEAESQRRTTGLVAGAVVVTVAFAVTTWPSRRLTGEALGPLR